METENWGEKGQITLDNLGGTGSALNNDGSIMAISEFNGETDKSSDLYDPEKDNVKVYQWDGSSWNQIGQTINNVDNVTRFGYSLSLNNNGTILAISSARDGSVYIFKYDGSSWNQLGSTIKGDDRKRLFGLRVVLNSNGDSIAISDPFFKPLNYTNDVGAIYVFDWDGSTWNQRGQTLFGLEGTIIAGLNFGFSCDGKIVSVNSGYNINSSDLDIPLYTGYVQFYYYNETTSTWEQIGDTLKGKYERGFFGYDVKIAGSEGSYVIAIGAPAGWNPENPSGVPDDLGRVEIGTITKNDSGYELILIPEMTITAPESFSDFGANIYLSENGTTIAISAAGIDKDPEADPNSNEGKVYIYELNGNTGLYEQKGRALFDDSYKYKTRLSAFSKNGKNVSIYEYSVEENGVKDRKRKVFEFTNTWDICFKAGSSIETDQGLFNIEDLNPSKHTIDNQEIIAITTTHPSELEYLVCIEKDAFGLNVPNKDTYLTHTHKVQYKGQLVEAMTFLLGDFNNKIYKVEYKNELLYNVLLKDYTTMNVNNLTAETLDPKNPVAQKYLKNITENNKINI